MQTSIILDIYSDNKDINDWYLLNEKITFNRKDYKQQMNDLIEKNKKLIY